MNEKKNVVVVATQRSIPIFHQSTTTMDVFWSNKMTTKKKMTIFSGTTPAAEEREAIGKIRMVYRAKIEMIVVTHRSVTILSAA